MEDPLNRTIISEALIPETNYLQHQELVEKCQRASHDLRSPLSSLNLVLSRIDSLPDSHRELIQLSLKRINDIARDLMFEHRSSVSTFTSSKKALETEKSCDVNSICKSILMEKTFEYQELSQIQFEFESHLTEGTLVSIKESLLQRILSNFINNAVEAMNFNCGKIKLMLFKDHDQVKILVQDDGQGIPENILHLMGHKMVTFGKTNSPNAPHSGNGIGVYSAQKYISQSGGSLEFSSKEGLGTSVLIRLPISLD